MNGNIRLFVEHIIIDKGRVEKVDLCMNIRFYNTGRQIKTNNVSDAAAQSTVAVTINGSSFNLRVLRLLTLL